MLKAIANIFKIPELRNKVLFTIAMLGVYRIGFWIPVPGVNQARLREFFEAQSQQGSGAGRLADFVSIFSGGSLGQSTIFGLGIMPYISAAIIFQLLTSVMPGLKKIQDDGPSGRQKITEWTRYATIGLCVIQAFFWLGFIRTQSLVYLHWSNNPLWWITAVAAMTAGTTFLMWLGEQIDKYGIGNGVSLIITAGILAKMPGALMWVVKFSPIGQFGFVRNTLGIELNDEPQLSWMGVIFLFAAFFFVVAGAVLITVAQRRIPVQQAKHTRGRRVFGGQRSYLPLRINHAGVMPIIFASSLMIFPSVIFGYLNTSMQAVNGLEWLKDAIKFASDSLSIGAFPYIFLYIVMVYFFSYFWTTVQFNPEEMSKQLRDHGSFIPGLRPGPRTAEYLETVMERITYVGAGFLAVIAVIPMIVQNKFQIPFMVAAFLGGTGLLIVVSVGLDFVQRIEANLLMRNYAGFLGGDDTHSSKKMRGTR
ncbi:MAG: preprotein translocase subunit SecY [Phycisphaeraceae bacterium]|nr:preprotein translocase subunit SecY [Phycisphaeraceae bacterium]MCB9847296.1 preprotein translocase subunit SecY [Phycisphaeraceae bacterium]